MYVCVISTPVQLYIPRCQIRRPFMDASGSMCTSYSSLGKMDKDESENSILLLSWLFWHIKNKTPLLTHENVTGFLSNLVTEQGETNGYGHLQVKVRPSDVGMAVGRMRKHLSCLSLSAVQRFYRLQ